MASRATSGILAGGAAAAAAGLTLLSDPFLASDAPTVCGLAVGVAMLTMTGSCLDLVSSCEGLGGVGAGVWVLDAGSLLVTVMVVVVVVVVVVGRDVEAVTVVRVYLAGFGVAWEGEAEAKAEAEGTWV